MTYLMYLNDHDHVLYCEIVVLQKLKLGYLLNLENRSFDKKLYQTYLLDYSWLSNMHTVCNKRTGLKIFKRIFTHRWFILCLIWLCFEISMGIVTFFWVWILWRFQNKFEITAHKLDFFLKRINAHVHLLESQE